MGSSTMIDILGSMLIGGLLLLVALKMNDEATKNTFQCAENLTVQQNMTLLTEMVESDFRIIGYCSNPLTPTNWQQGEYITAGGASYITFVADMDNSGNYSTIQWALGGVLATVQDGKNTFTTYELDRSVTAPNGQVTTYRYTTLGLTQFLLQYYNYKDSLIPTPFVGAQGTQTIQLTITMIPTAAYDTSYSAGISVWKQKRLASMVLMHGR